MRFPVRLHYDNGFGFDAPHLWIWYDGSDRGDEIAPCANEAFGAVFAFDSRRPRFNFKFKDGPGQQVRWEDARLDRRYHLDQRTGAGTAARELWVRAGKAFVYEVEPRAPEAVAAAEFLGGLDFASGTYVPGSGGFSGLGANLLTDGRVLFGLYHPNAARVFAMGGFNDWQRPGHPQADPDRFAELHLYRGYFGEPNLWLGISDRAATGDEYKFAVYGGVPRDHKGRAQRLVVDPYARRLADDFQFNNPVIVDPTTFAWTDGDWRTPDPADLILYELSVHGFTDADPDIDAAHHGRFAGITERIRAGYFDRLGVSALSLMPLSEFPSMQGPTTLGYDPSLFCTVERDFGAPDDLRALVDSAHAAGLAVILDQVFNHTSNNFNPLWQLILEHPDEAASGDGGLYFSGATPWGNRVATENADVQNMLIDACKLLLTEYHVDGFRFDATHSYYMDHGFLLRLARELKGHKPDVVLIAENLPNETDLNRTGFDGFAQWSDPFHDKLKAMLREGEFEGSHYDTQGLADAFYFSKGRFAAHTNNVVNYCESHDEHSVPHEVGFNPALDHPGAKERKARLGLFASLVALGQPMIYMGQEFNVERPRNIVAVHWPDDLDGNGYFQWARRLVHLRRRYPGLRVAGYDPAADGRFSWMLGPWMDDRHGGGRRLVGWRSAPNGAPHDRLVVLLNFENHPVQADLELGAPGVWVKLADIDRVDDIPPYGGNSAADPMALVSVDGRFASFDLPGSSGFVYKWEAGV